MTRTFRIFSLLTLALTCAGPRAEAATAIGVSDTSNVAAGQSVSALFSSHDDWVHTFLGIEGTSGAFRFGVGGIYKFTVLGTSRAGFHVGPGLTLGTVAGAPSVSVNDGTVTVGGGSKFAFHVYGAAGGHFTLFERLIFSVDAGPVLAVVDGNVDFGVKPLGQLLGISVHYLF